jgi:hypothetical protein
MTTCDLHNVRDCATCFHAPGECAWGACHLPATRSLVYRCETRPLCDRHADLSLKLDARHGVTEVPVAVAAPFTANIGDGPETFASLAELQRAVYARVSGIQSSGEWYGKMRSKHGAKVRDARAKVVACVSYNARLWTPDGKTEIVVESAPEAV